MASQLYKVLNNIEQERQSMVKAFQRKGYPVSEQSTLADLSYQIEDLVPTAVSEECEIINGTYYYSNPENDPDVWTEYKQWPDIYKIFKDIVTVTYNNTIYYPQIAYLFQTNETEITISASSMPSITDVPESNQIKFGLDRSESLLGLPSGVFIQPVYQNYTITVPTITLTEQDKVIGLDGQTYYYIIQYISEKYTGRYVTFMGLSTGSNITMKAVVADTYYSVIDNTSGNPFYANTKVGEDLEVLYLTDPSLSRAEIDKFGRAMTTYCSGYPNLDLKNLSNLKVLYLDHAEYEAQNKTSTGITTTPFNAPNLNTIINTNKYVGASAATPSTVIYYKTPTFCSGTTDFAYLSGGARGEKYTNLLKYLDITDLEAHKTLSLKTCYFYANNENTKERYYGTYPFLLNTDAIKYCTSFTRQPFYGSFVNLMDNSFSITFSKWPVTMTSSGSVHPGLPLSGVPTKKIIINGLKEAYGIYFSNTGSLEEIILPDLERLSASSYGISGSASSWYAYTTYSIKRLVLPKLTEIFSGYDSDTVSALKLISWTLLDISMPSLISVPSPEIFAYCQSLYTLELGDGWKSSLDFSKNTSLSKESLLDLFNKLKTLEEDEQELYIKLPKKGWGSLDKFTSEEIAIAKNKGWTIQ